MQGKYVAFFHYYCYLSWKLEIIHPAESALQKMLAEWMEVIYFSVYTFLLLSLLTKNMNLFMSLSEKNNIVLDYGNLFY